MELITICSEYVEVPDGLRMTAITLTIAIVAIVLILTSSTAWSWLMRDEKFRLKNQVWCYYHHQYEDADPCFRHCYECGHVFHTEEEMIKANAPQENDDSTPLLTLHACPYCLHDW